MSISKTASGWLVDSQPGGRGGKRFRKTLKTQAEAKAYEAWLATQVNQNAGWQPEKRDTRRLSELVELWFQHHGNDLNSGEDTTQRLLNMCKAMGNPTSGSFTATMFVEYRSARLADGISANNLNREHAYLRSVFNELGRLGYWTKENPLAKLRQFKIQESELSYLSFDQIDKLLSTLKDARNPHVYLITQVCLSTGARWGEAEELRVTQVKDGQIQFAKTKSGKVRAVPISEDLQNSLVDHFRHNGQGERIFGSAFSAFRDGIDRAAIALPEGQLTVSVQRYHDGC